MSEKKPKHYINNPDFLAALIDYQTKCDEAKAAGKAGEPTSIQTMPYYLMLVLACLAGLLGLRQLRV